MSLPLRIYLVRHAETAWSLTGQHTGCTDLPLTPHGEAMARNLAQALQGIAFEQVLTSPRLRARKTCELAGLDRAARIEPDLAEWDYGDYEGLRTAQIRDRHPDWNIWDQGCPGGETPADAGRRADRLISRLRNQSGRIALFSHGQIGRVLAARWVGLGADQGRHLAIDPACIGILGFEDRHPHTPVIRLWNESASGRIAE